MYVKKSVFENLIYAHNKELVPSNLRLDCTP